MLKSELSVMRFEVVLFKSFYGNRKMEHPLGVVILVELTSEERGVEELPGCPFSGLLGSLKGVMVSSTWWEGECLS